MPRPRLLVACAAIVVLAALAAGCGGSGDSGSSGSDVKVALVTDIGGLNDRGFNALANGGLERAEKDLGIQGRVFISKSASDYVPNLTSAARDGYDLVIGVGFLMGDALSTVAQQFPDTDFAIVDFPWAALKDKPQNVRGLVFAEQEAGYLVGVIAATMAKDKVGKATHNTVCSMGGIPIPPVDHYIAGYQDAVKTVSPSTTILNGYSNDFVDQAKGKEVGLNHISKNCDILFQVAGGSGLGYIAAAKDKGVYAIGVDADQIDTAPGTVITSALKRVNKAVYNTVQAVKDGKYKAGDNFFSAANDGIGYGKLDAAVPANVKAAADQALTDIKSGKIVPKDTVQVKG